MKGTATPFMRFEKPMGSAQGMAIWEDRAFILYDSGFCGVYDLESKASAPLDFFPLGSWNDGDPAPEYRNHANSCMFAGFHWQGNPIPLLYVTAGSGIGQDADGFFYRCAVENITCRKDADGKEHYRGETLQTITYMPQGIEETPFMEPCWGCPCFLVDSQAGFLYIFSAKYRTKRGCVPDGERNRYIITKFPLPDVALGGMVRLTPGDILDQFSVASDIQFTQGGTLRGDKIYYTFGIPKKEYPVHVCVFDLKKREMTADFTDMDAAFCFEEIECCDFYHGRLLCNTNGGGIYALEAEE